MLVVAWNSAGTVSKILQNITAIPSVGNFESTALLSDSAGFGLGYFSNAPNGQLAYCNGVDTCLWSGDEDSVARFINSILTIVSGTISPTR